MMNQIINYMDEIIPNPRCELNYNKDYELLIATMLSAQTTDKRVNMVTEVLFTKYDSLEKLSNASILDIESIIKSLGAYKRKAINVVAISKEILKKSNGIVPNDREFLESLPGVGRKTTNVVLSNIYDEPLIAVDTHVARVSKRLRIADTSDDVLTIEKKLNMYFDKKSLSRLHHQLVLFGRYYCKAVNPLCDNCKLKNMCIKNDF